MRVIWIAIPLLLSLQESRADEVETLSKRVAILDVAITKCGDPIVLSGNNFLLMQVLFRGILNSKSAERALATHRKEFEKTINEADKTIVDGLDYCLGSLIWFQMNLGDASPVSNMRDIYGKMMR